jgi:3-isopropylmalate/(R)-2-methylmalate dehydratase small subunit
MSNVIRGAVYVVRDNIDTDQIIPAQYLNLVPTIREEYEKLGAYALCGLPQSAYSQRYVAESQMKTAFPIVIAGRNFGCGSSREHAPIALGAAGCAAVVAESFARIFFRNCVATGELYPVESPQRLCDTLRTGDVVEINLDTNQLTVVASGQVFPLKSLGEARPVIDAGGIFEFARASGMIKK